MLRFITPPDAAIFAGLLGIVMVLTGREIGGAIVIAASLGAFVFFEWWLYHRKPTKLAEEMRAAGDATARRLAQWEESLMEREQRIDERENLDSH